MPGKRTRIDPAHRGGFDFTGAMRSLCNDVVTRVPEMRHIDLRYVALATSQTRKNVSHGLYASLTPLRFKGGAKSEQRRGHTYQIQTVRMPCGTEMLYILTFYLPRFMQTTHKEKLVTVFHELWHISPEFNGDLRRHPGRCYAHTHSQEEYDRHMGVLVDQYLAAGAPADLHDWLQLDFRGLQEQHGKVFGMRIKRPKLFPISQKA